MVYLLLRLPGFRQLRKLYPDLLDAVETDIRSTVGACSDELSFGSGSYFYVSGESPKQLSALAGTVDELHDRLSVRTDRIQGFVAGMLADSDSEVERVLERLAALLLHAPGDDTIWTESSSTEVLSSYFELARVGRFVRVSRSRPSPCSSALVDDDAFVDTEAMEAIDGYVSAVQRGETGCGAILYGGSTIARRKTLERGLEAYFSGDAEGRWFVTEPIDVRLYGYSALVETIRIAESRYAKAVLPAAAEEAWSELSPHVLDAKSEHLTRHDVELLLRLCVDKYLAWCAIESVPPVWVIHEPSWIDRCSRELIEQLISSLLDGCRLLVVISTPDRSVPGRWGKSGHFETRVRMTKDGRNDVLRAFRRLAPSAREVYHTIDLGRELFNFAELAEIMKERGILTQRFRHDTDQLTELGILGKASGFSTYRDVSATLSRAPADDERTAIVTRLCDHALGLRRSGRLRDSQALAALLAAGGKSRAVDVYETVLRDAYERLDATGFATVLIEAEKVLGPDGEMLTGCYRMRLDDTEFDRASRATGDARGNLDAERACSFSEILERRSNFHEALDWSKRALMIAGETGNAAVETRANLSIGRHMLGLGRVSEAQEYFDYAGDRAERTKDLIGLAHSLIGASVALLIIGNLSRAERSLGKADTVVRAVSIESLLVSVSFLRARLLFDLGRYEESATTCVKALPGCELSGLSGEMSSLCSLLYRASIYSGARQGLRRRIEALEGVPEAGLLLCELEFFEGDYPAALTALRGGSGIAEQSDGGRNGGLFSPVEGMARIGIGKRLYPTFTAYIEHLAGRRSPESGDLSELIREEHLDPNDAMRGLYCYFFSRSAGGAGDLERLTALSRAAKYVHTRAAKIDDASMRREYLHQNYWNRRIIDEARESKLM